MARSLAQLHAQRLMLEQAERRCLVSGPKGVLLHVRHELARVRRRLAVLDHKRAGIVVVGSLAGVGHA